ncbi:MAG TPA: hypothetical protein VET23_05510 [Chitinophagaceae bacterium]|nr:hypothetical protein [Chitinophagaceae bacterium]
MKIFFAALLFFSFPAFSQNCNLQKEKDPITNEPKISTGFFDLQGASVSIDADSKNIDFFFTLNNSGKCFDYESSVTVFFEGGHLKTTLRNSGTVNCEGYFHFTFRNTASSPAMLTNLSAKKVISLKFTGTNKTETTVTPTAEQQQTLMALTTCIINESKTLLPNN